MSATEDFTIYAVPPNEDGVCGISRDLNTDMLKQAYWNGYFPWPCEEETVLWSCPDPRGILPLTSLHIPHTLKRDSKKFDRLFELRVDTAFDEVIDACAAAERPGQDGTWITQKILRTYKEFHRLGYAHSFETFDRMTGKLAGGLYGISIGKIFCGESMFHRISGASKFAFLGLINALKKNGVALIDTQMVTPLTQSFGAYEVPAAEYIKMLRELRGTPLSTEQLK